MRIECASSMGQGTTGAGAHSHLSFLIHFSFFSLTIVSAPRYLKTTPALDLGKGFCYGWEDLGQQRPWVGAQEDGTRGSAVA